MIWSPFGEEPSTIGCPRVVLGREGNTLPAEYSDSDVITCKKNSCKDVNWLLNKTIHDKSGIGKQGGNRQYEQCHRRKLNSSICHLWNEQQFFWLQCFVFEEHLLLSNDQKSINNERLSTRVWGKGEDRDGLGGSVLQGAQSEESDQTTTASSAAN